MSEGYSISELAREFQVTTRTLRFYEDQGMISPLREGLQRIYRQRDRMRLKLILRGRRLGFALSEIREIVDLYDAPAGEQRQLALLVERIAARRAELLDKRADIDLTVLELERVAEGCRARLAELAPGRPGPRRAGDGARP